MRCNFVTKTIYGIFIVAKNYLRIFARPDLIGKLRSKAAPQVMVACCKHPKFAGLGLKIYMAKCTLLL